MSARLGVGFRGWAPLVAVGAIVAVFGVVRLVFNIAGARSLGIEAVGSANLALSWAMLVALPISAGIAPMVVRFAATASEPSDANRVLSFAIGNGLIWLAPPLAMSALASTGDWLSVPAPALLLTTSWAIGYSSSALARAWMLGRNQLRSILLLEGVAFLVFACGMVGGVATSAPWLPFTAYFAPALAVMVSLAARRGLEVRSGEADADLRRFAAHALLGSVVSLGIASGATLLAARDGLRSAGVWALLMSLVSPLLLAPRTLGTAMLPRLSRASSASPARFRELINIHRGTSAWVGPVAIVPLLLFGDELIQLAVGRSVAAPSRLTWMALLFAIWGTIRGEPLVTAVSACGRADSCAKGSMIAGSLAVLSWLALRHRGLEAIALAYAFFTCTTPFVIMLLASRAELRLRSRAVTLPDLVVVAAFAIAIGASGLGVWTRAILALGTAGAGVLALSRLAPPLAELFADS